MNYSIIGLIIDIIGGFLLFCGTEKLNKQILHLMRNPPDKSDSVEGISLDELTKLSNLNVSSSISNVYGRVGLLLIILGFVFQLIGSLK